MTAPFKLKETQVDGSDAAIGFARDYAVIGMSAC
jgi:hypothetical protein